MPSIHEVINTNIPIKTYNLPIIDETKKEKALKRLLSELKKEVPDHIVIRYCCKLCGVPEKYRGEIWKILLNIAQFKVEQIVSNRISFDLPNQRVIKVDINRTYQYIELFQQDDIKHNIEVLLTLYCKQHGVSYKQGMNYILAPFFLLNNLNITDIYMLYQTFINNLINNIFNDNEFGALQTLFALFRLLLQYHDPELSLYLDLHTIGPELYASSWFITLFANRLKPDLLFILWDLLLIDSDKDPNLYIFFCLALIIYNRDQLLTCDEIALPSILSKMILKIQMKLNY